MLWGVRLGALLLFAWTANALNTSDILALHSDFVATQQFGVCNFALCCDQKGAAEAVKKVSSMFRCLVHVQMGDPRVSGWEGHDRQITLVDMDCPNSRRYLKKVDESGLLRSSHAWLLTFPGNSTFEELSVSVNSATYLASRLATNSGYTLQGIYRVNNMVRYEDMGVWSMEGRHLNATALAVPWSIRRIDLQGTLFRVGIVATTNKTTLGSDDLEDAHVDSISKLGNFVMSLILHSLNATKIYVVSDVWGNKMANGSFTGMVGEIDRDAADVAASPMFPTQERIDLFYFIETPVVTNVRFVFMSPALSFRRNIFALPFSREVWCSSAGLLCLLPVLLYVVTKVEVSRGVSPRDHRSLYEKSRHTWGEIVLMNIATICQQGSSTFQPIGNASRVLVLTLLAATIFLYVSYSAYIVVLLQATDPSLRTLHDLVHSKFRLAAQDISYNRHYLQTATEPVRKEIAAKILTSEKVKNFITLEQGVEKIQSRLYAFLSEPSPLYQAIRKKFTAEERCGLQELHESYFPSASPMWGVRKNYTYTEQFRLVYRRLMERGHIRRIRTRLYTGEGRCSSKQMSFITVGLADIYWPFELLLAGFILSSCLVIAEILLHRRQPLLCRESHDPPVIEFLN